MTISYKLNNESFRRYKTFNLEADAKEWYITAKKYYSHIFKNLRIEEKEGK